MGELSTGNIGKSEKLRMLSEMLTELDGKAPKEPVKMLFEFKEYSWKPLSSYIHGGAHAIQRHSKGYPPPLLDQVLKASNGVSLMTGNLLVILSGDKAQSGKISAIQAEFIDCLPSIRTNF